MTTCRPILFAGTLLLALLPAAMAQDTGGVTAPESHKGAIIKGKAPVAKELLKVRFPRPQAFTLPNGLRIFVLEDHRLPSVRFSLQLRAGTLMEPKPAVAEMTAAMLDEGTQSRSSQQLAADVEDLGAMLSATASDEWSILSLSGLSENTDRMVDLMADVLLHATFPQDRLTRVLFRRRASLAQDRTNPTTLAADRLARVLYGDTPYGRVLPTPDELAAITRDDLVSFHDQFYRPNGAILGISGDVRPAEVAQKVQAALAGWTPAPAEPALPKADFTPQLATKIYLVDRPGSTQTVLSFGNLAISRTDPDYIPLVVADHVLGGGASGRLFQNLREDKGYTYGAYSRLTTPRWIGSWGGSSSVQTPVTAPAVGEFLAEFQRIQDEPVSKEELNRAKRAIVGSFARTLESPEGILARALELVEYGLSADYWDTYPAKIQAVSAADVQRVARKYLGSGRIQLVAVGERTQIEQGLKKYGPVEVFAAG